LGLANVPGPVAQAWLGHLATVLEQVRTLCDNRPLVISSGFRSPDLNRAVGGDRASAHLEGRAADFTVPGLSRLEVCRRIMLAGVLPFDQLIFEGTWVHLGIARAGEPMRRQVLTAIFTPGQKTRYVFGLPRDERGSA
jgi:hypothetical protein